MIRLVPVKQEERNLLWNINQKYLYEMTLYYPDPMDEEGNYHYGHFEEYFTDPQRKAFFLFDNGVRVGFAMVHPYSVLDHSPDYTMAEFAIFPTFRRKGYAEDAARLIFSRYPGKRYWNSVFIIPFWNYVKLFLEYTNSKYSKRKYHL